MAMIVFGSVTGFISQLGRRLLEQHSFWIRHIWLE